jgi:hypothetical protein
MGLAGGQVQEFKAIIPPASLVQIHLALVYFNMETWARYNICHPFQPQEL